MARELPRTLFTLSPGYQRAGNELDYEVLVMDNGSRPPVTASVDNRVRLIRVDDANPSPARAINLGLERASGELVGVLVDGARMLSPGVLLHAALAYRLHPRPAISVHGFHLGTKPQMKSLHEGYDQSAEDALLESVPWQRDGYQLFRVASFAGSSKRGWFAPMAESHLLLMPRAMWDEIGGYDEAFTSVGGGLVCLDVYRRATSLPGSQTIVLLGEATFHQFHGGAATNAPVSQWPVFAAEYRALRGLDYAEPKVDAWYFGGLPQPARRTRISLTRPPSGDRPRQSAHSPKGRRQPPRR